MTAPSQRELRVAERPDPPRMRILGFRPVRKNSLVGFITISMRLFTIHDAPVLVSHGKAWVALPSKPLLGPDGKQVVGADGKPKFAPTVTWASREIGDRFSDAAIKLIRRELPGVLEDERSCR
jgi:hypothetical protein